MKLGKVIKQARMELYLSQADLAEKNSMSSSYLSQIENDLRMPSLQVLEDIANSMGMQLSKLIYRAEEMPKEMKDEKAD